MYLAEERIGREVFEAARVVIIDGNDLDRRYMIRYGDNELFFARRIF